MYNQNVIWQLIFVISDDLFFENVVCCWHIWVMMESYRMFDSFWAPNESNPLHNDWPVPFLSWINQVDEEGATAAAATAVFSPYMSGIPRKILPVFRVDHPFFVALVAKNTTPVFVGHVTHPDSRWRGLWDRTFLIAARHSNVRTKTNPVYNWNVSNQQ